MLHVEVSPHTFRALRQAITGKHLQRQMSFYAVARGRIPGVYTQWDHARAQVESFPNSLHQKFSTEQQAKAWLLSNGVDFTSPMARNDNDDISPQNLQNLSAGAPGLGTSPITRPARQADDTGSPLRTGGGPDLSSLNPTSSDTLFIYTDGACPANGTPNARAGIGVFYNPNDPRNISARLPGPQQTNQRAELYAVLKALESLYTHPSPHIRNVVIFTDSNYVVKALTTWSQKWEQEGWKTADKKQVVSMDLFKRARDMLSTLSAKGLEIKFTHVPGHSGIWGNEQADRLAVAGSQMEQIVDEDWDSMFDDDELDVIIAEMENV